MAKTQKQKNLRAEVIRQMITLATSGFGLVAALAWNNVIQEFVNTYVKTIFPNGSGIISLLIYAVFITVFAVAVTLELSKLAERIESDGKRDLEAAAHSEESKE